MNKAITETPRFRISIIEDSEIHRECLIAELTDEPYIDIVSVDCCAKNGITNAKLFNPDLIILDFQLYDLTGLETAKRISAHIPNTKFLLVTAHTEPDLLERIIQDKNIHGVGIKGSIYFSLNLTTTITHMINGGTYIEPTLLNCLRKSNQPTLLTKLTDREFEIFIQTAAQKPDQLIASHLNVEISHVRNIKSKISSKLRNVQINTLLSKILKNSCAQ